MKRKFPVILILILAFSIFAIAKSFISIGIIGEITQDSKLTDNNGNIQLLKHFLFNSTFRYSDNHLILDTLKSFNSSNGIFTLELQKGIRFWDGRELDTSILKELLLNSHAFKEKEIKITDQYKLIIIPEKLLSYSEYLCSYSIILFEDKEKVTLLDSFQGTGPFLIDRITDRFIILNKNPSYFKGSPKIDQIKIQFYKSYYNQFYDLMNGELDIIYLADYSQVKWLKNNPEYEVIEKIFPFYITLLFNFNAETPLNHDQRCFLAGIFNQTELQYKFKDYYNKPAVGFLYPNSVLYEKYLKESTKQKKLDKPDFYKQINILYFRDLPILKKTAFYIQDKFSRLGIKSKLTEINISDLKKHDLNQYQVILTTFRAPQTFAYHYFKYGKDGVFNYTGYYNPNIEDILLKGFTETDKDKLAILEEELFKEIMKDTTEIFLFYPKEIYIKSKRIKFNCSKDNFLYDSHQWEKLK